MAQGKDRATQPGVRTDDDAAAEAALAQHVNPPSAREEAMERMEATRLAEFTREADVPASQLKVALPDDIEEGDGEKGETNTDNPVDAQISAQLTDDGAEPKVVGDGFDKHRVKVKIDGVESEVSIEELKRQFQKGGAADKRLAEATRLLEEAKKVTAAAPAVAKPEPEKTTDPNIEASEDKFIKAMFSGDEEAAREAFREALNAGRQPSTQPSIEQIVKAATPALKQQLDQESALKQFGQDYADVLGDPYLAKKADDLLVEALNDGKPFDEALKVAGDGTRGWLTKLTGVAPRQDKPSTTVRSERLERKTGLDTVVGTGTKAVMATEEEPSASSVIAQMRAARGQA